MRFDRLRHLALFLPLAAPLPPAVASVPALVEAARDDAVDRLLGQVESEPVAPDLTAGELLDALGPGARERFRRLLADAPQLGGPRRAVAGTAQVQVQADGAEVAADLMTVVDERPEAALPQRLTRPRLRALLGAWDGRSFIVVGRSALPRVAERAAPTRLAVGEASVVEAEGDRLWRRWAGVVSDEGRQRAFEAARQDAVRQVLEATRPVPLLEVEIDAAPPPTVGDAYDSGSVGEAMRAWVAGRPVTKIQFGADSTLEMRLSVEAGDFADRLRTSMADFDGAGLPPVPESAWPGVVSRVRAALPEDPVGRATVEAAQAAPAAVPEVDPPAGVAATRGGTPAWAHEAVAAQGTAPFDAAGTPPEQARSRLRAARRAESAARADLRSQLAALPLPGGGTAGDAAAVLDAVVADAAVSRVTYGADAARVSVTADGRELWRALLSGAGD